MTLRRFVGEKIKILVIVSFVAGSLYGCNQTRHHDDNTHETDNRHNVRSSDQHSDEHHDDQKEDEHVERPRH